MQDSAEKAIRDRVIRYFDYKDGVFRRFFTSPFEQFAQHVGKPFVVVKQTRALKLATDDECGEDDMYFIRFDDGVMIEAFGHEVCVLNYGKCIPVLLD